MPIRTLQSEIQDKAIKELNENPSKIQDNLKTLREWANAQPHLKIRTDDQWLLNFLRGCKFDLELVKKKLDTLYTLKTRLPKFFSNRDPFSPEIQELLKLGTCLPLLKTHDATGPRVVLVRAKPIDPASVKIEDGIKLILMIMEILCNEDDSSIISGGNLFVDAEGLTMDHLFQIPTVMSKAAACVHNGYCLNHAGIHVINVPPFALAGYDLYKGMAEDESLLESVHIYEESNKEDLYKTIPLHILPREYGGDSETIAELTNYWKNKVESYKDWFLEDAKYGCDETKRPGGPKPDAEIFPSLPLPGSGLLEFD